MTIKTINNKINFNIKIKKLNITKIKKQSFSQTIKKYIIKTYKYNDFVLLKSINKKLLYKYYIVKGSTFYVNMKIKNKINNEKYIEILRINNISKSIDILNRLKQKLKNKVEFYGNRLKINTINEVKFIKNINFIL